jgi:glycosyltransferase involved in cell wall biosynthesis
LSEPVKILWICGSRVLGGAERVTLHLATLLQARGHVVETLCRPDSDVNPALAAAGLTSYLSRLGGKLNVRAVTAIRHALDRLEPDVALVTAADEWIWSCLARRRTQRSRLVLVRHMTVRLNWRVRGLATQRADAVVAVSDAVRRSLVGRLGVRPDRIHVIHNPVRFTPRPAVPDAQERAGARAALGLPQGGHWVGFFGGLSRAKGLLDVIQAVSRSNKQLGCTNLLVCGRGVDWQDPASIAREFKIEDRLRYLGQIERVEEALTAVDVLVMPTHNDLSEALPATLLEAMACGTPVLGYATGGIVDAVGEDGQAGRLARADDVDDLSRQLIEVLADPTAAEQMATAALERTRQLFDPHQAADRYERLFRALCSPAAPVVGR